MGGQKHQAVQKEPNKSPVIQLSSGKILLHDGLKSKTSAFL